MSTKRRHSQPFHAKEIDREVKETRPERQDRDLSLSLSVWANHRRTTPTTAHKIQIPDPTNVSRSQKNPRDKRPGAWYLHTGVALAPSLVAFPPGANRLGAWRTADGMGSWMCGESFLSSSSCLSFFCFSRAGMYIVVVRTPKVRTKKEDQGYSRGLHTLGGCWLLPPKSQSIAFTCTVV